MENLAALEDLRKVAPAWPAGERDTVVGVQARYVVSPASTDDVAEVLRVAGQHGLTVVARGAGTTLSWGAAPTSADVLLDITGLCGVVEHVAGDMVVVVRAGTPVTELQAAVGAAGQRLALDVPYAGATVGGTLATSTSGPLRLLYGTARDLLIGITFVRADGVVAHSGGKVVKNVAGYDLGKLLTGSFGTLGVITEAVFRLHALPADRRVVQLSCPDGETAARAARVVLGSQVVASAVELSLDPDGTATVTVLVEGAATGVAARIATTRALLGPEATERADLPADFTSLPFTAGGTALKVTSSITGVATVLAAVHDLAVDHGVTAAARGSAAGVLHVGLASGSGVTAVAAFVAGLRAAAASVEGSSTVLDAPPDVRAIVDLWGPVPGLDLMRRLKNQFDPDHRLSPGRFVGGI